MSLEAALIEHSQLLRELLARLTAPALTAVPEPVAPPKPGAVTAPTAPTAEAVVSKPAADVPALKDEAEAPAAVHTTTYDDVKRAILDVSKAKGRDAAIAVLAQFGATKGPDLQAKPETFGPFVAAAKAVIGG